jgi:tetratricopeptide (TPR) repeat protein
MDDLPETHLASLGPRFLEGLNARAAGRVDAALEIFAAILKDEPRLAEPRLEIARIWLEMGRLEDAEEEAREALRILEAGGQWTDEIPEPVLQALAWALLGEILKEKASSDEVVFGDPAVFTELLEQSRAAYARAAALDPTDATSSVNAMELGDRPARRELGDTIPEDEFDEEN